MDYKNKEDLLQHLENHIKDKLKNNTAQLVVEFARHYFTLVAFEDIQDRQLDDLYGAVLSHWNLALEYMPGDEKIKVYNPCLENHGWRSPHTIVEIVVEDMPFLLQSITMEINRYGFSNQLVFHPVYAVVRTEKGVLKDISLAENDSKNTECMIQIEIDRQSETAQMRSLETDLIKIIRDVRAATEDWKACQAKLQEVIDELQPNSSSDGVIEESVQFLQWLYAEHFVLLGYREYDVSERDHEYGFSVKPNTGLGVLRDSLLDIPEPNFIPIPADAFSCFKSANPLLITKATSRATVYRPVFMDYIGIKQYGENGDIIGEKRFLGLYSSTAYSCSLNEIPIVKSKIARLFAKTSFQRNTHGGRALLFQLQSLPRDELFQADDQTLMESTMGVLQLQERQRVRVFVRHDVYGHFVSLLIFVPRERYHTESRKKIQEILLNIFNSQNMNFSVQLSESILARIHFVIHSDEGCCIDFKVKEIEQQIIEVLAEWKDSLKLELYNYFGEAKGNEYLQAYCEGFTAAYREEVPTRTAVLDLKSFTQLQERGISPLGLLYSPITATEKKDLHFKLYCYGKQASLSKSLPMLENMGVTVCNERPYEIDNKDTEHSFWIHDFGLHYDETSQLDLDKLKPLFEEAFEKCWTNFTKDDGFNRLIIKAGLNWQQVNIIRAFYLYLRQIGIAFSQSYVELTLASNPEVVKLLIKFFYARFDPSQNNDDEVTKSLLEQLEVAIENVSSLDEDRILRRFLNLAQSAVRTNYFLNSIDELGIPYYSFKFDSAMITEIPSPIPYFEVFVYSARMEGIHLRGGAVARGGLRWSDRREDFRTEVLGLMKAQMTKNSVIVPTGAKGGFIVKNPKQLSDKKEMAEEVVNCYRILIRGLLDITDNYVEDTVVKPVNVNCYDKDDPYLVVAADKGTATFSDYANELAKQYGFWLGDGFASGGSVGYDHKAMGITARGAWESVKHHFELMGHNVQETNFTVVGIGGMAGDVFGNGMLLSQHIKLVGTFDHESIFLDPNPDIEQSYSERKRLFELPRSSWRDYDEQLISKGGGIFSRQAKIVSISKEVKKLLLLEVDKMTPNDLIRALLCAPVDLIWNGGIGTYVKSSGENNIDVGDRANDAVRVNGFELRCKAVGEGGNLGCTQLGRIEYALNGGKINTDSIDNSAGVDCSDHEVNIKILVNSLVKHGELTDKQRDELLEQMTDQVATLVLKHNYQQNRAITMIEEESAGEFHLLKRLIEMLEIHGNLDRKLECIPDNEMIEERISAGIGLTRPEVSVILAYSKQKLKAGLLAESVGLDKDLLQQELQAYFPTQLQEKYTEEIQHHRLGKEIVANRLINSLVNHLGVVFPYRLMEETGCSTAALVNTYKLVCKVFDVYHIWNMLVDLDGLVAPEMMREIKQIIRVTIERSMYWFLRNLQLDGVAATVVQLYVESIAMLSEELSRILPEINRQAVDNEVDRLIKGGVNTSLALKVSQLDLMCICLNAVKVHQQMGESVQDVANVMLTIISELKLSWLRDNIKSLPKEKNWESLARQSMWDEFNNVCSVLTIDVLAQEGSKMEDKIAAWLSSHQDTIAHYQQLTKMVGTDEFIEVEKIIVILNELSNIRSK